jgi:hypothetical protein
MSNPIEQAIKEIRQAWYDENNKPKVENESPRDVGIRVGYKSGLMHALNLLSRYCTRCNKFHNSLPVDPDKIVKELSQQIANDIDLQVIENLKNNTKGDGSISYPQRGSIRDSKKP